VEQYIAERNLNYTKIGSKKKKLTSPSDTPSKKSSMDQTLNTYVKAVYFIFLLFCLVSAIAGAIWLFIFSNIDWYLRLGSNERHFWNFIFIVIRNFGTYYILLGQIVPMSLYVNMVRQTLNLIFNRREQNSLKHFSCSSMKK
jgi:hypothetical protein